jgi:hypothetical protein
VSRQKYVVNKILIPQITFKTEVIPHTLYNLSALLDSRYAVGELCPEVSKPNETL